MGTQDTHPGSALQAARIAAGLTIPEVAAHFHRCTATVMRWERGQTTPPRDVFVALANLYRCQPADLVDA
jgi:DNA-binding transcriptional regulator YiaG